MHCFSESRRAMILFLWLSDRLSILPGWHSTALYQQHHLFGPATTASARQTSSGYGIVSIKACVCFRELRQVKRGRHAPSINAGKYRAAFALYANGLWHWQGNNANTYARGTRNRDRFPYHLICQHVSHRNHLSLRCNKSRAVNARVDAHAKIRR